MLTYPKLYKASRPNNLLHLVALAARCVIEKLPRPSQGGSENTMTPSPLAHETNARFGPSCVCHGLSKRRLINLLLRNVRRPMGLVGYKMAGVMKNGPHLLSISTLTGNSARKNYSAFAPSRSTAHAPPIESALGFVARTIIHL